MFPRIVVALLILTSLLQSQAAKRAALTPEQRTAKYFDSIKNDPVKLRAFLRAFPKGGDLHNHLSGAIYAESYIRWAAEMGLCAKADFTLVTTKQQNVCDEPDQRPAADYAKDAKFYNGLIDALSMRNWNIARESGEYHFFSTFSKFGAVSRARKGDMLAEVMHRAVSENTLYLELILTIDAAPWINAGKAVPWPTQGEPDFADLHKRMLAAGLAEATNKRSPIIDEMESRARQLLRCGQKDADPGCGVTVRYISEVYRLGSPETVFAQFIWGFELAKHDPRIVAVNPVQPEDGLVAMRDYDLHMRMLDYLHKQYPQVHITLHAGELAFGLVPPEELGTHIPKAIDMGHAQRIGHGTDVMHYSKPDDLMKEMRDKNIAVEISPSSSDMILGINGAAHPLKNYIAAGVPVVISTDDAGVARSDLTNEYMRAVMESGLSYADLKKISRLSLEASFTPGESFWKSGAVGNRNPICKTEKIPPSKITRTGPDTYRIITPIGSGLAMGLCGDSLSEEGDVVPGGCSSILLELGDTKECGNFLLKSPKASLQYELESKLSRFEQIH